MPAMRTFRVEVTVQNPVDPSRSATVECLVDIGAAYSQLPSALLESLGITHFDERPAILADRRPTSCRIGRAEFVHDGRQTPALVVFGEGEAPALLGAMTLEGLGLGVDPIGKRLIPVDVPMAPLT
jgi:predicted aspartyl protease